MFINAVVLGSYILLYTNLTPQQVFGVVSVFLIISVKLMSFSHSIGCLESSAQIPFVIHGGEGF